MLALLEALTLLGLRKDTVRAVVHMLLHRVTTQVLHSGAHVRFYRLISIHLHHVTVVVCLAQG